MKYIIFIFQMIEKMTIVGAISLAPFLLGLFEKPESPKQIGPDHIRTIIDVASMRYANLDPAFLTGLIYHESKFDPNAVGLAGEHGLGQLMPIIRSWCGVVDGFDPVENANCSARFLSHLLYRYNGDERLAAAAYNAGEPAVDSCVCVPQNGVTPGYVTSVLTNRDRFALEYADDYMVELPYDRPARTTGENYAPIPFKGVDYSVGQCGADLYAPQDGWVSRIGFDNYSGQYGSNNSYIEFVNTTGLRTVMLHGNYSLEVGDRVTRGKTKVGVEASIGNSLGCHTDFWTNGAELRRGEYVFEEKR